MRYNTTAFAMTAAAVLFACCSHSEINLIVGTYTGSGSAGIYNFCFDTRKGMVIGNEATDSVYIQNPSYLVPARNGEMIYAVSEMPDSTASVYTVAFDRKGGQFNIISRQLTQGEDPCYVSTDGNIALTANYSGGSMSIFPVSEDGEILPLAGLVNGHTGGPDSTRQATPHIHCAALSPNGKYVYATDFSADKVLRIDASALEAIAYAQRNNSSGNKGNDASRSKASTYGLDITEIKLPDDFGPRHIVITKDGSTAYVIGELSGAVSVIWCDSDRPEVVQTIQADPVHARGSADIRLSPDERFLYASNRLSNDGIAIFAVGKDRKLEYRGYTETGRHPRNFRITPDGKYLLVACRDDDSIQIYSRDSKTGLLHDTGGRIHVSRPVCIEFIPKVK